MALKLHGHKLQYHIEELLKWQNKELFAPIFIEFGPVSGCNHRCVHCHVQKIVKKTEILDEKVYLRFMKEIGEYGVKAIVLAGCGEPLIHKATPKAIEIAKKHGTDVGMFTNGVLINDSNIDSLLNNLTYLRLSINGCSEVSYKKIHQGPPGDWKKLMENMKSMVKRKKELNSKCTLGVYTLMLNDNLSEIETWAKKVKEMGFDYIIIKPPGLGVDNVQYVDVVKLKEYEPAAKRIEKLSSDNFTVQIRWDLFRAGGCVRDYERCLGLPFMCAVDSNGGVYACNWLWKDKEFKYGDLNKNTFKEIWESEKKAKIIERVESENFDFAKCGYCRQNEINKFLWKLANQPEHVNFI